jgi:hypothetical protein
MSEACAEVSNKPCSVMLLKIYDFPNLNNYSIQRSKRTGERKLVGWWLDMIRMYSEAV